MAADRAVEDPKHTHDQARRTSQRFKKTSEGLWCIGDGGVEGFFYFILLFFTSWGL